MLDTSYPVRLYCPIADAERMVYFLPVKNGEKYTVNINMFNGCEEDNQTHPACEACKKAAFEIMKAKLSR